MHAPHAGSPPASQDGAAGLVFGFVFFFLSPDFNFTLLITGTDRSKTREKSRSDKVMFYNSIFEAKDTFPGTS